jgi:hypothetical protein
MLVELRRLLREETASKSFWDDPQLLDMFNASIDERVMQLATVDESWVTDEYYTSIVAGQREYPLPEGVGRVKRVMLLRTQGSRVTEIPLLRNERWSQPAVHGEPTVPFNQYKPSYRLLGNLLLLEPWPTVSETNGLRIDLESAPARLASAGDKLALRFPDIMETVLIYDTAVVALAQQNSQGAVGTADLPTLEKKQASLSARFAEYVTDRTEGRVAGPGLYLGD